MTLSVNVKVNTEPSRAYGLASDLASQAKVVEEASSYTRSAESTVTGEMRGKTVGAVHKVLSQYVTSADQVSSEMESLGSALEAFGAAMASVKDRLLLAREDATKAGLEVSGDTISVPPAPTVPHEMTHEMEALQEAHAARVKKFREIKGAVEGARKDEDEAHRTLESACRDVQPPVPVQVTSDYDNAVRVSNNVNDGAKAAAAAFRARSGTFRPRDPRGRWVTSRNMRPKDLMKAAESARNWCPKPGVKSTFSWKAADALGKSVDKAAPVLKTAGRVSTVASGAVGAWKQYQTDSEKHPNMGEREKLVRAGVKGGAEMAGAWAGAKVGAQAGAVFGSMIGGPAGAVIGGIAGGVIGGFLGSKVGEKVGDAGKDLLGGLFRG